VLHDGGGAARVLITSNFHAWREVVEPVDIRLWPKEIGAGYLIVRAGRNEERDVAEAASRMLDGLPLAHEQAAAYCERLQLSLAEYLKRFEATPIRLLDNERDAPAAHNDGMTVARSFTLGIEEACKLHPGAESLIVHAALPAPEPIPLFLFSQARKEFEEPLASALAGEGLDEAVAALLSFARLTRESIADERDPTITTDTIRIAPTGKGGRRRFSADRDLCATPQVASWKEKWADARDASPKWGRRTTQTLTAYRGCYGRCKQANRLGGSERGERRTRAMARSVIGTALALRFWWPAPARRCASAGRGAGHGDGQHLICNYFSDPMFARSFRAELPRSSLRMDSLHPLFVGRHGERLRARGKSSHIAPLPHPAV
jgi:hypothetical protein